MRRPISLFKATSVPLQNRHKTAPPIKISNSVARRFGFVNFAFIDIANCKVWCYNLIRTWGCVGIGIQCGLKIRRPLGLRVRVSSPPPFFYFAHFPNFIQTEQEKKADEDRLHDQ